MMIQVKHRWRPRGLQEESALETTHKEVSFEAEHEFTIEKVTYACPGNDTL